MMKGREFLIYLFSLLILSTFTIEGLQSEELPSMADYYTAPPVWSYDGHLVATASDSDVIIWETETQQRIRLLQGHRAKIQAMAWSPNALILATASLDQTVKLWDTASGKMLFNLTGSNQPLTGVLWSPDGKFIFGIGAIADETPLTLSWSTETGLQVATYENGNTSAFRYSPDQTRLASASTSGLICIGNTSFEAFGCFENDFDRTQILYTIAWHPNNQWVATGSLGGGIYVWDIITQKPVHILAGNSYYDSTAMYVANPLKTWVRNIMFTHDGNTIQSVSANGTVRAWDLVTGQLTKESSIPANGTATWSVYGGQIAFQELDQSRSIRGVAQPKADMQISTPLASIEQVKNLADACYKDRVISTNLVVEQVLSEKQVLGLEVSDISNFITQVKTLPEGALPAACAADLIAVAEAILAQP